MKRIKCLWLSLLILATACTHKQKNIAEMFPDYKLINMFSQRIAPETGLVLTSYAINSFLPKDYKIVHGIGEFDASYKRRKGKMDNVSLEEARSLAVFVTENFLQEINSSMELRDRLDVYPFTSDRMHWSIYFEDENRIELGQGVAHIFFAGGVIKYVGYHIYEYTDKFPACGEHYTLHEESYAEALDLVKKQNMQKHLKPE